MSVNATNQALRKEVQSRGSGALKEMRVKAVTVPARCRTVLGTGHLFRIMQATAKIGKSARDVHRIVN